MAGTISFPDIVDLVGQVVANHIETADPASAFTLESVLLADKQARAAVEVLIADGANR